jgi:hypothetical protein
MSVQPGPQATPSFATTCRRSFNGGAKLRRTMTSFAEASADDAKSPLNNPYKILLQFWWQRFVSKKVQFLTKLFLQIPVNEKNA